MDKIKYYQWTSCLICLLFICLFINGWIYWQYSRNIFLPSTIVIIHSGLQLNSFNPQRIHLKFNASFLSSHALAVIDNQVHLPVQPVQSSMTIYLSNGYHHLQFLLLNPQSQSVDYYQAVDVSTGQRSLIVTILDEQYQPVNNLTVHMELVDHTHINNDLVTNDRGEVQFQHLPEHTQVYIEAVCQKRNRHAFVQINTSHYRNITIVLREMNSMHYDEYDSQDRGYYAV